MRYSNLIFTFFISLFISQTALGQDVAYVTNTNNAGNGSLRYALNNSNSADTVIIDVAGTLNLTASIDIYKNVVIIGPSAIHFTINISNLSNAVKGIFSFGGNKLKLSGITVEGGHNAVRPFNIHVGNDTQALVVEDCLFEDNVLTGGSFGGVIYVASSNNNLFVKFNRCSFFNNSMNPQSGNNNKGGAIAVNKGTLNVFNCTFSGNSSTLVGAIYVGSTTDACKIINNTFVGNSCIQSNSSSATDLFVDITNNEVQNNIFKSDDTPYRNTYPSSPSPPYGNFTNFPYSPSIAGVTEVTNLLLKSTSTTDGFGLKYFLFDDYMSPCIDAGIAVSGIGEYDARRSWRTMYGKTDFNSSTYLGSNTIDVGAIEYTPFRVTNANSSLSDVFNELDNLGVNASITGNGSDIGKRTVVFEIHTTNSTDIHDIQLNNPSLNIKSYPFSNDLYNNDLIVNGFSQEHSKIGGPGSSIGTITPAFIPIQIDGNGSGGKLLLINANNVSIAGLSFIDCEYGNAIEILANNTTIEGCHIGIEDGSQSAPNKNGIYSAGTRTNIGVDNYLKGLTHAARNVISKNTESQITIAFTSQPRATFNIKNNLIGLKADGYIFPPINSSMGILIKPDPLASPNYSMFVDHTIIGGHGKYDKNYFGAQNKAINIEGVAKIDVINNSFGFGYNGTTSTPNSTAIFIHRSSDINIRRNKIGNCVEDAITLHNSTPNMMSEHHYIINNIIGIDKNDDDAAITGDGISIYGSSGEDGSGTAILNGGNNMIEGNKIFNCNEGIRYGLIDFSYLDDTNAPFDSISPTLETIFRDTIRLNIVGNTLNGSPKGNGIGIYIADSIQALTIIDNVIAHNTDDGITTESSALTKYIHITHNSLYNNHGTTGIGIDLDNNNNTTILEPTSNKGILAPKILGAIYCNSGGNNLRLKIELDILDSTKTYQLEFFKTDSDEIEGQIWKKDTTFVANTFSTTGLNIDTLIFPISTFQSGKFVATLTEHDTLTFGLDLIHVASTSEFSAPFTVNTYNPTLSFFPNDSVCEGDSVAITVLGMGVISLTSNFSLTTLDDSIFYNNSLTIGTHTLSVTSDSLGCSATTPGTIQAFPYTVPGDTTATACSSFEWYGIPYTSTSSPTHTFVNSRGCDSIVTLHLTIGCDTDGDGVTNGDENSDVTDPDAPCDYNIQSVTLTQSSSWNNLDCDGDGVTNGDEIANNSDPLDPCSPNTPNVNAGTDSTICQGSSIDLTAIPNSTPIGITDTTWQELDSTVITSDVSPNVNTKYVLSTTANNCTVTDTIEIEVTQNDITLIVDSLICEGDEVIFNFESDQDIDLISWLSDTDNGVVIDDSQVTITNPTIGLYNLKPSIDNCFFDFEVTLVLNPNCTHEVTLNAFNPNADLIENQFFNIDLDYINEGLENVVKIYNRWGDIVFQTNNYDNKGTVWRGKNAKGKIMMEATYFYTIEVPSKDFATNGWVYLNK